MRNNKFLAPAKLALASAVSAAQDLGKKAIVPAAAALTVVPGMAMAGGGGTDFSGILDGVSGTTAVTAVVGAAAILAIVGFAVWGAKKVAKFFG